MKLQLFTTAKSTYKYLIYFHILTNVSLLHLTSKRGFALNQNGCNPQQVHVLRKHDTMCQLFIIKAEVLHPVRISDKKVLAQCLKNIFGSINKWSSCLKNNTGQLYVVACWNHLSGCCWLFAPISFWIWWRSPNSVIPWGGGDSQTLLYMQKNFVFDLNFFHSHAVRMQKVPAPWCNHSWHH